MVAVMPLCRFLQYCIFYYVLKLASAEDIYYSGQSTFPFLVEVTRSAHWIVVSGSNTVFRRKHIVCWGELIKLERPSFPTALLSEGMLSLILSYWFRTIIQCARPPISALSSSERIDPRPRSASLSDWCAVEMKTGQITNEVWLRSPRANRLQPSDRMGKTLWNIRSDANKNQNIHPFMNPTSYCG